MKAQTVEGFPTDIPTVWEDVKSWVKNDTFVVTNLILINCIMWDGILCRLYHNLQSVQTF